MARSSSSSKIPWATGSGPIQIHTHVELGEGKALAKTGPTQPAVSQQGPARTGTKQFAMGQGKRVRGEK